MPLNEKKCVVCNQTFHTTNPIQKNCSKKCSEKYLASNPYNFIPKPPTDKKCSICNKKFKTKNFNQKTCSEKCREIKNKKTKETYISQAKPLENANCFICNKIFIKKPCNHYCCSKECSNKRTKQLQKEKGKLNFFQEEKRTGGVHPDYCVYCGDFNQCRDHVIPVSVSHTFRTYNYEDTVDCCMECNKLAGDFSATCIEEKAAFLVKRYQKKYNSILELPKWDNKELDKLDGALRMQIKANENKKRLLTLKINNLELCSYGTMPKPIEDVLKLYRV
jgi:predicted nucleic acid-binding Zn ribbon protein